MNVKITRCIIFLLFSIYIFRTEEFCLNEYLVFGILFGAWLVRTCLYENNTQMTLIHADCPWPQSQYTYFVYKL